VPSFGDRIAVVSKFLPEQRFAVLRAAIHQILGASAVSCRCTRRAGQSPTRR
jgi:hypothetical protein